MLDPEAPGTRAPQPAKMRAATQGFADILAQDADIGAFAAHHAQHQAFPVVLGHFKQGNPDATRRALDLLAAASEAVERRSLVLERRMHWRHLVDLPPEALQYRGQRVPRERNVPRLQDRALGIAGRRALAELQRRQVLL